MIRCKKHDIQSALPLSTSAVSYRWRLIHLIAGLSLICAITACSSSINNTPEQHLTNARNFVAENNLSAAIIEIKNALQKDPNLQEGRWLLGSAYLQLGMGASAESEFINARELGYAGDELDAALLRAFILQRKFQDVLSETNARDQAAELPANILILRGDAFLGLGQITQALSSYKQALEMDNSSVDARLGLARIYLGTNELADARRLIEEAEGLAPQQINVLIFKGELGLRENEPEAAETAFTQAIEIADYNIAAQFGLIRSLLAQNKFDEAIEPLNRVVSRVPQHPMGKYFRAIIALGNNDMELARTNLLEVLRVLPNHAESQLIMAQLTYSEGQFEQSLAFIKSFLIQYPSHIEAQRLLATTQVRLNQTDAAINTIERIIANEGEDPQLLAMLAAANLEAGNVNAGSDLLKRATELAPDNALIGTQLATAYLNQGEIDQAITSLEIAISNAPEFLQARVLLVATHIRNSDFEAAIAVARELTNSQPESAMAYNLLGTAYSGSGNNDLAREQFERALVLEPAFIPALYNLARLEIAQDNPAAAEDYYRKIIEIDASHLQTLLELASLASQGGEIDEMVGLLEQARAGNPQATRPRLILGRHYMRTGDNEELFEIASEAANSAPTDPDVQLLLGQAQRMNGNVNAALATLTALQGSYPESPVLLYELARVQLQAGNNDAAKGHLNEVLRLMPEHAGALSSSIQLAIYQNDPELARNYTRQLQDLQPDSPATYSLMGDTYASENRFDEAIAAYEEAYKTAQTLTLASKLSQTYEKSGNTQKAKSIFEQWQVQNPEDVRADLLLAGINLRENNVEAATRHYESVLTTDPDNIIALNNLSWFYIDTNLTRAYELAERANKIAPQSTDVMDTLGWILVKQGKHEQGLSLLRRALAGSPESPDIRYHLAYGLAASGNEEQARNELSTVLDGDTDFMERASAEELLRSFR